MKHLIFIVALFSFACGGELPTEEVDGGPPDADAARLYCERYQVSPPPCYKPERNCVCGNETVCQQWRDFEEEGGCFCFQCRVLFFCECDA